MRPGFFAFVLVGFAALVSPASPGGAAEPGPDRRLRDSETRAQSPTRVRPAPPDVDLLAIRDIFRYGDEAVAGVDATRGPGTPAVTASGEAPLPPPRVRLVGIVRRSGRTVAALSIDGEVLLLGEGESSDAGFTVLAVAEDSVRLREPGGNEKTLPLP